jgi:hypothetical protein
MIPPGAGPTVRFQRWLALAAVVFILWIAALEGVFAIGLSAVVLVAIGAALILMITGARLSS